MISITASPRTVVRGGALSVTVEGGRCGDGTVSSPAFTRTERLHSTGEHDRYRATATIRSGAVLGAYEITAHCDGRSETGGTFTVVGAGAARGGLGGLMSPSSTELAVGGGMVVAAVVGGGVHLMRRRAGGNSKA
ncbi:hypothetical protein GUY61_36875 [Streptomyces sp. GC420]|nr:hypothetical protein [Streptomyces sp. GC420]